jgi:glutaredoxin 2
MTQETLDAATEQEYSQAINTIGQHLFQALSQTVQSLPQHLRNARIVNQALAAFMTNAIAKQFPEDKDARIQTMTKLSELVNLHLNSIP